MHYADTLDPAQILADLNELAKEDPLVWQPSPMIEQCAAKGMAFAEWRRGDVV